LKEIFVESKKIYNELSLELVKLFKLLIKFGKYPIRLDASEEITKRNN